MGRDERNTVSRIKVENLPKICQAYAKFGGPLFRIEESPDVAEGRHIYLGPFGSIRLDGLSLGFGRWSPPQLPPWIGI